MTAPCVHSRNWYKEMTRCLFCGAEYSDEEERRIHFERTRTFSAEQTAILEHLQAQPDHEHDFFCVHDEQQCDAECRLTHECRICHITVEQLRRKPCCKHPESDHVLTASRRYCTRCPCSTHECTCKTRAEGGLDMACPMHGGLHLTAAEEEATGRVICNDCGGFQVFKCEGNTIRVFHDCYTGKHSRESFRKLMEENAGLRKRCEAYEMLNLGLQEMLDAKACPDCHKQNS